MMQVRVCALAFGALLGLSGCWVSKFEGEQMQKAGQARDQRISKLEERTRGDHRQLDEKVVQLEEVLERATKILQRDSADTGAQISNFQEQLAMLQGEVAEIQHKLEALRMGAAAGETGALGGAAGATPQTQAPSLQESDIPERPTDHFDAALDDFRAERYGRSRALFLEYISRYPNHARTGEAQYWVAASYLQENKPATALGEYRKVISKYPKSTAVNVALYGMGDAFYRLHACTDAKTALETLLKRKPDRRLVKRTNELLRTVRRAPRQYCTS